MDPNTLERRRRDRRKAYRAAVDHDLSPTPPDETRGAPCPVPHCGRPGTEAGGLCGEHIAYGMKAVARERRRAQQRKRDRVIARGTRTLSRLDVLNRDEWVCHICRKPIPRFAVEPMPEFGTVDHIIPLSRGGHDSDDNIAAAHLKCNKDKAND